MSSSFASSDCSFGVASCSRDSDNVSKNTLSHSESLSECKKKRTKRREVRLSSNNLKECPACNMIDQENDEKIIQTSMCTEAIYTSYAKDTTHHRKRHRPRRLSIQTWYSLILLPIVLTILMLPTSLASPGDRSPEYQNCVESCKLDSCYVSPDWPEWDDGTARTTRLPLILRITGWSCIDDCKYHCTHRVTNEAYDRVTKIRQDSIRIVKNEAAKAAWSQSEQRKKIDELVNLRLAALRKVQKEMVQFHGKWVFIRFLGAQEPLSVLFSLLNFQVHFRALSTLRKQIPEMYPLKLVYILHALLSCSAWFWSAVFHTRDRDWTEKLDYFAAGSVILGGWFIAVCRLLRLGPDTRAFGILLKSCGVGFALHVIYLSIGRFDYSYNMKINIFFGLFQSGLWLAYSIRPLMFSRLSTRLEKVNSPRLRNMPASPTKLNDYQFGTGSPPVPVSTPRSPPPSSNRKSKRQLQKIIIFLILASCLEVFDFPPIARALDAHALWHAATVPLAAMWYQWLIEDARECTLTGYWIGEGLRLKKSHTVEKISKVASHLVGSQVVQAYEKTIQGSMAAKKWVEAVAGKSSNAIKDATGTSSGIEFKALSNKLHEVATEAFGNSTMDQSDVPASTTRNRTTSISNNKTDDHSP